MEVASRRKTRDSTDRYKYARERENEYEFDFNDISRASTPTSTFSTKSEGRKRDRDRDRDRDKHDKDREHRYSADDYKRKIARLKSELDLEKAKAKKIHKEKSSELREVRETYEIKKQSEIEEMARKMKKHEEKEVKRVEEETRTVVAEEKDKEVQQVLKYKEEEVKDLRNKYKREKESAIQVVLEKEKTANEERERKLNEEIEKLRKEKEKMAADYKRKCAEESKKEKEFARIKEDYDSELRRILGESKKLALGNLEKLKKAEKALNENASDDEMDDIDFADLVSELQSQASSRAVSRSVSVTSEIRDMKLENLNFDNLIASPAVTPGFMRTVDMIDAGPSPLTVIKEVSPDGKVRSSSAMSEPAREMFNRRLDDKDRQLQKRVSELQTQSQRLERKIALLKTENETLKRKQDDKRPLEEKIKTLKKRNAELAAIARRLEEKAKHLQQENSRRTREMTGQHVAPKGDEQMKKMFARQRAKDLAEHARSMLSKDREIEELRQKCQELADQLSNADFLGPDNSEMYEEKEELVLIIKQAAKERLQLERQLAVAKPGPDSKVVSVERYKELEDTNETLKNEITKLERLQNDTQRLEIELTQKTLECERLSTDITYEKTKSKNLESELEQSSSANTQLSVQVSDLQTRLQGLEKVNEECSTLRITLSGAQHDCEVAKGEVSVLHGKVQNLETIVKNLEYSTEKLQQVERDYHEASNQLVNKRQEIDKLKTIQESASAKYETAINSLQEKILGLETQCLHQENHQVKLTEEIAQLRTQAAKRTTREIRSTEIQTGKSIEFAPSATSSPNHSPRSSPTNRSTRRSPIISISPAIPAISPSNIKLQQISKSPSPLTTKVTTPPAKVKTPTQDVIILQHNDVTHAASKRPLVIDHSESQHSGGTDTGFAEDYTEEPVTKSHGSPEPDRDAFEDPELYEIAKKLKELEAETSDISADETSRTDKIDSGMGSNTQQGRITPEMSVADSRLSVLAKKGPIMVHIAKYSYDPYQYSPNENPEVELPLQSGDYVLVYGEMDEDGFFEGELIDGRRGLVPSNFLEKVADEDLPDFHAAMAMIGHADDDSTAGNSIQQDLDFDSSEEVDKPDNIPLEDLSRIKPEVSSDLDDIEEEDEEIINKHNSSLRKDIPTTGAPYPKNLQLDRQLANSILVSWRPPDDVPTSNIRAYHVFLDGDFKLAVRGSDRTKALLENVETRKVHRVSVRCISTQGQSHDNHCTILVGKDILPAPFDLRISDVTANSAMLSWSPGDSNLHHVVLVNSVEVRALHPGIFSHALTGLVPAASHKVVVQAKLNGQQQKNNVKPEQLSSSIAFKTQAGGVPDAPVNVQVESGPQEGTILLTWLPITIDTRGFSNGALITGYVIYADGQKAKESLGATNDHAVLTSNDFQRFIPKHLLVRTLTKDGVESVNSDIIQLSQSLIKEITAGAAKSGGSIDVPQTSVVRKSPLHGRDTDKEIESAFREITQAYDPTGYEDAYLDSSCSELSDIPEVEEETSSPELTNDKLRTKEAWPSLVNGLSELSNESSDLEEIYQRNLTELHNAESILCDSCRGQVVQCGECTWHQMYREVKADAKLAAKKEGKSPRSSSKSSTPQQSRTDDLLSSPTSPNQNLASSSALRLELDRSGEQTTSPRTVPAIEITRDSTEILNSPIVESEKEFSKSDSSESVTSSKVSSKQRSGDKKSDKYSANFDQRDGYRDNRHEGHSKSVKQNRDISEDTARSRSHSPGPRGASPRHNSGSPRRPSGPGDHRHSKGGSPHASSNSPRTRNSPRENSSERVKSNVPSHQNAQRSSPHQNKRARSSSPASPNRAAKQNSKLGSDFRGNKDSNANELTPKHVISSSDPQKVDLIDDDEGGDVDSISGEINPPLMDDSRVRLFVALFDYDPETMSPNVDAIDEELPFREGQVIKVYGDKDADGFYRGECGARMGFIPCNMVSEIQVDDPELEEQLLKECQETGTMRNPAVTAQLTASDKYLKPIQTNGVHASPSNQAPMPGEVTVRRQLAMYDYDPQELSPNVDAEVELFFKVGDILMTYGEMDDDGFYMGDLNGRRGLVPSNFLQETGLSDDEAIDSASVVTTARSGESINTTDSRKSEKNEKSQSPQLDGSPVKLPSPNQDQIESVSNQMGMLTPRSMTPEEIKQKKKSGGILSKGKSIFKKFTTK